MNRSFAKRCRVQRRRYAIEQLENRRLMAVVEFINPVGGCGAFQATGKTRNYLPRTIRSRSTCRAIQQLSSISPPLPRRVSQAVRNWPLPATSTPHRLAAAAQSNFAAEHYETQRLLPTLQ